MTREVALGVWQSLTDDELRALTPPRFYDMIAELGLDDEAAEDAWDEFTELRARLP